MVAEIVNQFEIFGFDCKVIAASFKNVEQVNKCAAVVLNYLLVFLRLFINI